MAYCAYGYNLPKKDYKEWDHVGKKNSSNDAKAMNVLICAIDKN